MKHNLIRLTLMTCGGSLSRTRLVNGCLDCLSQSMTFCTESGNCGSMAALNMLLSMLESLRLTPKAEILQYTRFPLP